MFSAKFDNNNVYIKNYGGFDLPHTLDCGQAFRWEEIENGIWHGVAFNKYLKLEKLNDGTIVLYNITEEDFENIWRHYFDLDRDYDKIITAISKDETLKKASEYAHGIRVLNQEPWETLCSFIISQNNNIKRIKGIISRLCENFGEDMGGYYTFPTAEKIASLTLEDLSVLRSGFRAKYILDAAKKVASGEVELEKLKTAPTNEARDELMKITGVGPKVADCVLLFALEHADAFPKDVWIKRAMQVLFDGELPECAKSYAGIAQQYIFLYARETKLSLD
ncbi:MAG: DNA-3-methyladenine glycosylase [Acutalibacteraceae bacterium]|nr:DNA-3-methyladenine glycosylase [Acutalibacteraceae bacterium]